MDLFRPEFRRRRSRRIEQRLKHIEGSPAWESEILDRYERKHGIANDLVQWKFLPRDLLERCLRSVPRPHLAAILRRLSENPGANKSGFPDLIVFGRASKRGSPSCRLIEVKSPADRLQTNQRRWFTFFDRHGIPFRLARVEWLQNPNNY